ncbi:MAG TPA: SDR family oxidoreductase [Nocardioides sp.]|nr:SDR family oxidoreductase [Nocardioides sp.]
MKISGKVWVVTGAGAGIGRELALALLDRGARVAAVGRSAPGLAELTAAAGAGERLTTYQVDIADRAAVQALPARVEADHGVVDGLINNAGIVQPFVPVVDMEESDIHQVMDINFFGTLHMCQAFLPVLMARPEAHLANTSSMGGFFPFPDQTVYGASKAAVKLMTEGLHAELLDTGVTVSVILTGAVATGILRNVRPELAALERDDVESKMMRPMPAEDAAKIILDGLEKDRLHVFVGKDARALSFAFKVAPRSAIGLVRKKMSEYLHVPEKT